MAVSPSDCRATGTQLPCFPFSPLQLVSASLSRRWVKAVLQINCTNKWEKASERQGAQGRDKSIGSNEDGNKLERRGKQQDGSGERFCNQVSHQLHVEATGTVFPRGNDCSGANRGLISDDWSLHRVSCTQEEEAQQSWFIDSAAPMI